jgi:hypothetical protein
VGGAVQSELSAGYTDYYPGGWEPDEELD